MKIEGKLHVKNDTVNVKDTFRKREFVVEYAENPLYPQFLQFQLVQEKCDLLDSFNVGDKLAVEFNLRGRAWNSPSGETKYFNSLDAWRLEPVQDGAPAGVSEPANMPDMIGQEDDLPF